jgi:hypothetical protein
LAVTPYLFAPGAGLQLIRLIMIIYQLEPKGRSIILERKVLAGLTMCALRPARESTSIGFFFLQKEIPFRIEFLKGEKRRDDRLSDQR